MTGGAIGRDRRRPERDPRRASVPAAAGVLPLGLVRAAATDSRQPGSAAGNWGEASGRGWPALSSRAYALRRAVTWDADLPRQMRSGPGSAIVYVDQAELDRLQERSSGVRDRPLSDQLGWTGVRRFDVGTRELALNRLTKPAALWVCA